MAGDHSVVARVAAGDRGNASVISDGLTYLLAVITLVGDHHDRRTGRVQNGLRGLDLCRTAASVDPDSLFCLPLWVLPPPFGFCLPLLAPLAARCALTKELSMATRGSRDFAAGWSKMRFQMPRAAFHFDGSKGFLGEMSRDDTPTAPIRFQTDKDDGTHVIEAGGKGPGELTWGVLTKDLKLHEVDGQARKRRRRAPCDGVANGRPESGRQ